MLKKLINITTNESKQFKLAEAVKKILKEGNETVGRRSTNPVWIADNNLLNDLIKDIQFPVKAFCDTSYLDMFIYVNPKNRSKLDDFMKSKGFKINKGNEYWGNQHTTPYHYYSRKNASGSNLDDIIKTKNKRNVPESF